MKNIILKSIFAGFVYLFIVFFSNIGPIKESFDDFAYDTLVTDFLNSYTKSFPKLEKVDLPNVNLFIIEDEFLEYYQLKEYGYVFPRKEMSSIVEGLNFLIEEMKVPPKIVFIDYDFHYTELPYGRKLSPHDKLLIENLLILSKESVVMIPKARKFHFIEKYLEDNGLSDEQIIFVSPHFLLSDDYLSRRFKPYYKADEKVYLNIDFAMYLVAKNRCKSVNELKSIKEVDGEIDICNYRLKSFDVTQNRMMPKLFNRYYDDPYSYGYTFWDKNSTHQNIRSISTLVEESVVASSLEDSIVLIGSDFKGNHDQIGIAHTTSVDIVELPGIVLHLSTLNSLYFFDGVLKNINPLYGSLIVFIIFFIFSYFEEHHKSKNRFVVFLFNATIMGVLFFSISLVVLLHFKLWFNWFAPLFTYQVLEIAFKIKENIPKLIELKNRLKDKHLS